MFFMLTAHELSTNNTADQRERREKAEAWSMHQRRNTDRRWNLLRLCFVQVRMSRERVVVVLEYR